MLISLVDTFKELDINRNNVLLLLSDAAPYMVKSGKLLIPFFPRMNHVFCTAHIIHNTIGKLVKKFFNTNFLLSSIKSAIVKNNTRKNLFTNIGQPPEPILTRWGSWLKAVKYYTKNMVDVKLIVNKFVGNGKLVADAKNAVNSEEVFAELVYIERNYMCLLDILEGLEEKKFSVQTIVKKFQEMQFGEDKENIKDYIFKRLNVGDILKITASLLNNFSPVEFNLLLNAQPTSIDVERSFSKLNKIASPDRQFNDESWRCHTICYCNNDKL